MGLDICNIPRKSGLEFCILSRRGGQDIIPKKSAGRELRNLFLAVGGSIYTSGLTNDGKTLKRGSFSKETQGCLAGVEVQMAGVLRPLQNFY